MTDIDDAVPRTAILLASLSKLAPGTADSTGAARLVVDFYKRWNRAQPDPTGAAHALEWRQRLANSPLAAAR